VRKKSLSSSVIKNVDQKQPSVKPYSMRDMSLLIDSQWGKGRSVDSSSRTSSDPRGKVGHLLKEVEERERYVKQIAEKADKLEKDAYEKGFAQGEKAGRELGEKRLDSVIKSFKGVLEEVRRLKETLYPESEQEMLRLVLAIARRVIQKEVSTDRGVILNMIKSALKYVADQGEITIRLNPSDLEFATQHKEENMKGMKSVIIEGDEEIQRGDAVIKSNRGTIDCGIEKHLQMVEEELRKQSGERIREEEKEAGEAKENHGKST